MLTLKTVSSLEKCFLDQTPGDFAELETMRFFRNEGGSLQLLAYNPEETTDLVDWYTLRVEGALAPYVQVRSVEFVPNYMPTFYTPGKAEELNDGFVRTTPGLYPDPLVPLLHHGKIPVLHQQLHPIWVDIRREAPMDAGRYPLRFSLLRDETVQAECTVTVEVLDALLPPQQTKVTQWFHADCLADYYDVESFSDKHFAICRRFIETAVKNGVNMMLVPVFTPPLDTAVGGERTTTQLVGVKVDDQGQYSFDFTQVDRYMEMCRECGVEYFEISHLFTQWGAGHAPKVMADTPEGRQKIFGWETDASGEEYQGFLRAFLEHFTAFLDKNGYRGVTYFHLSDEPEARHLEQYKRVRQGVADLLAGWKQLDAVSEVDFYRQGLCDIPVPVSSVYESFMQEDVPERWVYYCLQPWIGHSNRLMSMSLARTRFLGVQMYTYGIEGFLHWGYNFYNDQYSDDSVTPYLNVNGGFWSPGGDCFSVYPGPRGTALESIRLLAFKQGLDDIRALQLCQQYHDKETIVAELEKICGPIRFGTCLNDPAALLRLRERINDLILLGIRERKDSSG